MQQLGRDVEPGHCRLRRVMFQRQQKCRCLTEPGTHLFDLVDELSDRVGHLPAAAGELVCAILQGGQVRLQAAGLVHPHGLHHLGEIRQCTAQAVYRCVQALLVRERLQLLSQLIDRVEVFLIALADQPLERPAGGAAGLVDIADRVALQCRQHRAYPGEHVLAG